MMALNAEVTRLILHARGSDSAGIKIHKHGSWGVGDKWLRREYGLHHICGV